MGDRTRETRDKRWDLRYKRRETGDTSRETRYGRWETQWGGDKGTPNLFNVRNSRHITRRRAIFKKLPVARLRHVSDLCLCVSDAVTRWRGDALTWTKTRVSSSGGDPQVIVSATPRRVFQCIMNASVNTCAVVDRKETSLNLEPALYMTVKRCVWPPADDGIADPPRPRKSCIRVHKGCGIFTFCVANKGICKI